MESKHLPTIWVTQTGYRLDNSRSQKTDLVRHGIMSVIGYM